MLNSEAMVVHFPAVPVVCYPQIHHLTVERDSVTLVVGWVGSQLAVSVLI